MEYKQPDFYHFSEDSLALAKVVVEYVRKYPCKEFSFADFGCGCGVIGIEIARQVSARKVCFIELQNEFYPYLIDNCKQAGIDYVLYRGSWTMVRERFDLIVSNPPYFVSGRGRECPNPITQRCRSLDALSFNHFLQSIVNNLADSGVAFILGRSSLKSFIEQSELLLVEQLECAGAIIYFVKKRD